MQDIWYASHVKGLLDAPNGVVTHMLRTTDLYTVYLSKINESFLAHSFQDKV